MFILKRMLVQPDGKEVTRTSKSVALTIAGIVNSLLSVLLSIVATRILTKTQIAINSQTLLAYTTFSSFLMMGVNQGIYFSLTNNENRKRAVMTESILLIAFTSLIYCLFILFGGNRLLAVMFHNPDIETLLYFMIPYALIVTPITIVSSVMVYQNRLRFNAVYSTLQTLAVLLVVSFALIIFRNASAMVVSRVFATIAFSLISVILVYTFVLPKDDIRPRFTSIRKIIAVSLPLGIASMLGSLSLNLDKWIISTMLLPEEYAVYTKGAYELPFISTITAAISTVLVVDITKLAKEKKYNEAMALFKAGAEKTSLILIPLMMLMIAIAEPFICFLYTDAFAGAIPIFRVYLLYMPVRTVFYGPLLIALGKQKAIMWRALLCLTTNAVLSVVFVKLIGGIGATIATIATAYAISIPFNLYTICKTVKIKWYTILPLVNYGKIFLVSLPGTVAAWLLDSLALSGFSDLIRLLVGGSVFLLILLPIFAIVFSKEFKSIISKIKGFIRKLFRR